MQPRYRIRGLAILIGVIAFGLALLKGALEVPAAAMRSWFSCSESARYSVSAAFAARVLPGRVRRASLGYIYFRTRLSLGARSLSRPQPSDNGFDQGGIRSTLSAEPETFPQPGIRRTRDHSARSSIRDDRSRADGDASRRPRGTSLRGSVSSASGVRTASRPGRGEVARSGNLATEAHWFMGLIRLLPRTTDREAGMERTSDDHE